MPAKDATLPKAPVIGRAQIALLEKLSNACGVSGDEGEVRTMVQQEIKPFVDEMRVDALGNLLAVRKAKRAPGLRVMLAAHMDEVGLMIVESDEGGLFRFDTVGGINIRTLPGKPVLAGHDHIPGIIGAKAIHLAEAEELSYAIPVDNLRIDLGPDGSGKARPGDRATFATRFLQTGPTLRGKALDDRIGVTSLIELIKHAPEHLEFQAAFTVQEEVGLRGARVAAYAFDPQFALVLDATPAYDLPMWDDSENTRYNTRLGYGPAIYLADAGTLYPSRLVKFMIETAEQNHIPYQFRQPGGGGTDAGVIHRQRSGVPVVSLSVPARGAHTGIMLARLSDWKQSLALAHAALCRLTPKDIQ